MDWITIILYTGLAYYACYKFYNWVNSLNPDFSNNNIGKVSEHKGAGLIKRTTGDKVETNLETDVFSMDEVSTGQGRTGITFVDDTKVELTEHSKLIIDEFVYDPNTNTGALSLKASLGSVRYASGQIAKNSKQNVKISTPTATIAVRGTDFAMIIDELGGSTILLLPSCDTTWFVLCRRN
jgi:hypothetical protein